MTLPLTADTLRAAYDYLNTTPPFNRWNLPDGEDVNFKVAKDPHNYAWHDKRKGKRHLLVVSQANVGHTQTLLESVAHEMIHVHEEHAGAGTRGVEHSRAFGKWAGQVCKIHGFDPKRF